MTDRINVAGMLGIGRSIYDSTTDGGRAPNVGSLEAIVQLTRSLVQDAAQIREMVSPDVEQGLGQFDRDLERLQVQLRQVIAPAMGTVLGGDLKFANADIADPILQGIFPAIVAEDYGPDKQPGPDDVLLGPSYRWESDKMVGPPMLQRAAIVWNEAVELAELDERLGNDAASRRIREMLTETDEYVRTQAAEDLGELGEALTELAASASFGGFAVLKKGGELAQDALASWVTPVAIIGGIGLAGFLWWKLK